MGCRKVVQHLLTSLRTHCSLAPLRGYLETPVQLHRRPLPRPYCALNYILEDGVARNEEW